MASLFYKIGFVVIILMILLQVTNMYYSRGFMDAFSAQGRLYSWLLPIGLVALLLFSLFLKSKGRLLFANILIWIPATPFIIGLAITAFLALVFNLFGKH